MREKTKHDCISDIRRIHSNLQAPLTEIAELYEEAEEGTKLGEQLQKLREDLSALQECLESVMSNSSAGGHAE